MPNWVRNKVIVGKKEFIDTLRKEYCKINEESNREEFDFNKIKPMPEDMNIEFGSRSDEGLVLYMTMISPKVDYFGKKKDKMSQHDWNNLNEKFQSHMIMNHNLVLSEEGVTALKLKHGEKIDELIELGKKQAHNINKYNALNWYEWSVNNWGTKWNSNSFNVCEDNKSFTFETAWDPAIPVLVEMSRQHPEMKFAFLYSDEEIGCHVGYVLASGGKIDYQGTFKDQSSDAYKLAFDLWDCSDEYKWDEDKKTFIPKPYEEQTLEAGA